MKSFEFPQYRKYAGIEHWFKISSETEFTEVRKVGEGYYRDHIVAVQYPEKLRIQDMLTCLNGHWETVSSEEYNAIDQKVA